MRWIMHENAQACDVHKMKASRAKTQSKLQHSQSKQAHNLECMKTRLQCLKMQCISIWKQINKNHPKNYNKNPKISQKFEKPGSKCLECMRKE